MKIKILAFGIAKELFHSNELLLTLDKDPVTVADLRIFLKKEFPELKSLRSYMIAVNNNYAGPEESVSELDEVAVIPPVSGG